MVREGFRLAFWAAFAVVDAFAALTRRYVPLRSHRNLMRMDLIGGHDSSLSTVLNHPDGSLASFQTLAFYPRLSLTHNLGQDVEKEDSSHLSDHCWPPRGFILRWHAVLPVWPNWNVSWCGTHAACSTYRYSRHDNSNSSDPDAYNTGG